MSSYVTGLTDHSMQIHDNEIRAICYQKIQHIIKMNEVRPMYDVITFPNIVSTYNAYGIY